MQVLLKSNTTYKSLRLRVSHIFIFLMSLSLSLTLRMDERVNVSNCNFVPAFSIAMQWRYVRVGKYFSIRPPPSCRFIYISNLNLDNFRTESGGKEWKQLKT